MNFSMKTYMKKFTYPCTERNWWRSWWEVRLRMFRNVVVRTPKLCGTLVCRLLLRFPFYFLNTFFCLSGMNPSRSCSSLYTLSLRLSAFTAKWLHLAFHANELSRVIMKEHEISKLMFIPGFVTRVEKILARLARSADVLDSDRISLNII